METNSTTNQPSVNDPQYLIDTVFFESAFHRLEHYKESSMPVLWNGAYYHIYNLYLAEFLISKSVKLSFTENTIDGTVYLKSFAEGYIRGKSSLKLKWPAEKIIYNDNVDAHLNDIHRLCFHEANEFFDGEGWQAAARQVPYEISHYIIDWYGFFCGIMAGYDQLCHNHKALFEKLVRCEHLAPTSRDGHGSNHHKISPIIAPPVTIDERVHQVLYDALKPYIEKTQHVALSALIFNNTIPLPPIAFNCKQNSLARVFHKLLKNHYMSGTQKAVAQ